MYSLIQQIKNSLEKLGFGVCSYLADRMGTAYIQSKTLFYLHQFYDFGLTFDFLSIRSILA